MTFLGGGVVFIGNFLIADVQVHGKSVRVVAGWGGGGESISILYIHMLNDFRIY